MNLSAKKPTNLKLLEGNPGKRHIKKQEKIDTNKLKCPVWLSDGAKKEWRFMLPILKKLNLISNLDKTVFAMYCQNYDRWRQAEEELNDEKLKVLGRSGFIVNPLIKISAMYQTRMKISIEKLGLSPHDRANLDIAMGNNEDDGISKYLK